MTSLENRIKPLGTSTISDALDKLGLEGGAYDINPLFPGQLICGPAFTVRYVARGTSGGTVGDFIDDVAPGSVVVIDNQGRTDCTVWGDIMSRYAHKAGIEGTVIDGVCRDISGIGASGLAVYSRGFTMITGKDRVAMEQVQVPVSLSGVRVQPGDLIYGDDTGVVVIPLAHAERVVEAAERIAEREQIISEMVDQGVPLREARSKAEYHALQSAEIKPVGA